MSIEWSSSGANISVETVTDAHVASYAQKLARNRPLAINKHMEYLELVCSEFYQKISQQVRLGSVKQSNIYTPLTSEILQHFHLCRGRCEVFEGREDIVSRARRYLESEDCSPLTIHGRSGCGKTSVVARITEMLCNGTWRATRRGVGGDGGKGDGGSGGEGSDSVNGGKIGRAHV